MAENQNINPLIYQQLNNVGIKPDKLQEASQILNEAVLAHNVFMNFGAYKNTANAISSKLDALNVFKNATGNGGFEIPAELKQFMTPENLKEAFKAAKNPQDMLSLLTKNAKAAALQKADELAGGKGAISGLVKQGENAIQDGKATIEDLVGKGKAAIQEGKQIVGDISSQAKSAIQEGRGMVNETIVSGKSAISEARSVVSSAGREMTSMVEEPLALSRNVAQDIVSNLQVSNLDMNRFEQAFNVRMKLPYNQAMEAPDLAAELPSIIQKPSAAISNVKTLLQAPAEETGAMRGDSTIARVLSSREPGLPKIRIGSYKPKSRAGLFKVEEPPKLPDPEMIRQQATQELQSITKPLMESASGIQETSFSSMADSVANAGEEVASKASSAVSKAGEGLLSTEGEVDAGLTEAGPVGWAIEGGLLLATIGMQIADLFKKKHHDPPQPIIQSGQTIGV